jgi:hypothetical protein
MAPFLLEIMKKSDKRPKIECEVCGEKDTDILERHHIIPRTDLECTNDDFNLAVLCRNCHGKLHAGNLKIIGVFPGTKPPSGRILVYELDGVKNIDIDESYFTPKPKSVQVHYGRKKDSSGSNSTGK